MSRQTAQLNCQRSHARRRSRSPRGFTLIEAALATMIVGTAFVAVLQLVATGTVANMNSSELTTGMNLARNIRELTLQGAYNTLPTYNGATYSPPKDCQGAVISSLSGWQQVISVQAVDPNGVIINQIDSTPAAVRITVTVNHNSNYVCDLSWYCFDATP